ncbi:hypothetical protein HW555_009798 [Spodoptera exigua]|uniref:Uncharacterized protein n=1 Tax=Spodoptera exigua TaxID=7107 RepID=A0A835G894_SPOEX|nr:hypothetical protein HW555_009798 [Spodoptera exigua]
MMSFWKDLLLFYNRNVTIFFKSTSACASLAYPFFSNLSNLNDYLWSAIRGNYEAIVDELDQVKWDELLIRKPLNEAVTIFYSKLYELRDKYIPTKTIAHCSHPPWYNSALVKMLKEKYKYHRRYKTYRNISDYHSFSLLRNRVIELEKSCFNTYMANIESAITKNPKYFWSYIKSKNNTNTFPNVMRYGNETASTGEGISNLFAKYFRSTYQDPDPLTPVDSPDLSGDDGSTCISSVEISYSEVLRLLKSLDLSKADNIINK